MKTTKRPNNFNNIEMCIDDELLIRYVEKETSEKDNEIIEAHLDQCPICLEIVANLIRLEQNLITEEEIKAVEGTLKFTPQEQIKKIFSYYNELNHEESKARQIEKKPKVDPGLTLPPPPVRVPWRMLWPAAAVVFLVALWFGGINPLITEMQVKSDYEAAWATLQDSLTYNIFAEAQFSTDYKFRTTGKIMSMGRPELTFLDRAEIHLQNVLKNDPEHPQARQILTEIYIEERNFAKADSILKEIQKTAGNSAELLNNYGALYFTQGKWQKAAEYFQQAIDMDPGFIKAIFNLGLVKKQLGEKEEAVSAFNRYIELETDEVRRAAAERLIQEINQTGEEVP